MGEEFKPELVTVTPLTRGTDNHTGPTLSAGGSRPLEIHIHNEGGVREFQTVIKKVALEDFGMQV